MPKQVEKTDRVVQMMKRGSGDPNLETDSLAVFEARSFNTRPLDKKGSIFNGAVHARPFLTEMATIFEAGDSVPLLSMHQSGLPIGRVFHAEPVPASDGAFDLNSLFYLAKTDPLTASLDNSIIGEVSVGIRHNQLICNQCGFDYLGADAGVMNISERCCPNGHTIGQDGTHLIGSGLSKWMEMSLVDRGAAKGTSILPPARQILGADGLAASAFSPGHIYLNAAFRDTPSTPPASKPSGEPKVDLTLKLAETSADLIVAKRDVDALKASETALKASETSLNAKVSDLTAQLAAALATDGAKLKPELDAAAAFINEMATASLVAVGRAGEALPTTLAATIQVVRDARAHLAVTIPVGGVSGGAATDADKKQAASFAAFKTR